MQLSILIHGNLPTESDLQPILLWLILKKHEGFEYLIPDATVTGSGISAIGSDTESGGFKMQLPWQLLRPQRIHNQQRTSCSNWTKCSAMADNSETGRTAAKERIANPKAETDIFKGATRF